MPNRPTTTVATAMTVSPVVVSEDEAIAGVAEPPGRLRDLVRVPRSSTVAVPGRTASATRGLRASLQGPGDSPWTGWHGLIVRDLMTYLAADHRGGDVYLTTPPG